VKSEGFEKGLLTLQLILLIFTFYSI